MSRLTWWKSGRTKSADRPSTDGGACACAICVVAMDIVFYNVVDEIKGSLLIIEFELA